MASDAVPSQPLSAQPADLFAELKTVLYDVILARLASLKIAITLFAMSIFIIWVATLAQSRMDMWEVMDAYFLSWFAWIELQVFLPVAWAPDRQDIPGGFWFPGGALIGTGLVVNLLSAHLARFGIQARGTRLWIGLAAMAGAATFTTMIITGGHNMSGFQGEPLLGWGTMWSLIRVGIGALAVSALSYGSLLRIRNTSKEIESTSLLVLGGILVPLTVYLFAAGDNAYLGDSGMRILWQLIQATMAGIAILLACLVLYKRRGPVVTIHFGILLLMLGQFLVAKYDVEEQIALGEGETATFARDLRQTELAIVDRSDPLQDAVAAVPQSLLLASQSGGHDSLFAWRDPRLDDDGVIQDEELPFGIQVLEYYKNSELKPVDDDEPNLATAGTGLRQAAVPVRASSGTDSDSRVDQAAAYVKLLDKQGEEIGVYMVSQLSAVEERVTVDGMAYDLSLRFRRNYKPYAITLIDVRKDDYLGTSIPRNYSSDIRLVDQSKSIDRKIHIWMNNPLRYAGETFYQNSYSGPPLTPTESSTIAVVTNQGWMIPYVACMVVVVGLVSHFSGGLFRFLNRREREKKLDPLTLAENSKIADAPPRSLGVGQQRDWAARLLPLALVGTFAALFAWLAIPHKESSDEFRIHRFGRLPVVADGRVKPLDTLARNNLRVISNKYSFRARLPKEELEERWPKIAAKLASHWNDVSSEQIEAHKGDVPAVLDLIVQETGANRYRVEEYLDKLTTERQPAIRWLLDATTNPSVAETHKVFRIDNLDVLNTLGLERRKGYLYSVEEIRGGLEDYEKQLAKARQTDVVKLSVFQRKLIELDQRIRAYTRLAASFQPPSLPPLPSLEDDRAEGQRKLEQFLPAYREFQRSMDSIKPPLVVPVKNDEGEVEWKSYAVAWMEALIKARLANEEPSPEMAHMSTLLVAYRKGEIQEFNTEVAQYERLLKRNPPPELKAANTITGRFVSDRFETFYGFEAYFNSVSPFFFCWGPYLTAFVLACLAWVGWSRPLNRSAFWLIAFTFVIHTLALVARIYLSGRPPVTNLYSSSIFIGWAIVIFGLGLELVYRNGIGNVVGAALGFASLWIAHSLAGDGDTMAVLQAVLDTQFWLAVHVVIITLGYAATFLAGFLGLVYIVRGWLPRMLDAPARKELTRMIYGILCFALLFSFFGTILGGLWADDSWGRFWGWDPKENGALIIVLWNILVLHTRWDGLIKDRGLAVMAVVGNIVTSWSWFGVNELGVGLHSYGFTDGVLWYLGAFFMSQMLFIILGVLPTRWWLSQLGSGQTPGQSGPGTA